MQSSIQVENYQFSYRSQGDPQAPPILFLHGFMGNSCDFDSAIALLSRQFYCLAVDLPGHGATQILGGGECYSMANTAIALYHFLDCLRCSSCFLVGYSMGGRLALYMALQASSRFPKVVLESASPGLKTDAERQQRRQKDSLLAQQLEQDDFRTFLFNWYRVPLFSSIVQHPQFEALRERRLQNNPFLLARSLRLLGTGSQPSLWKKLATHRHPLLLLVGALDSKFQRINAQMAALCKSSELSIVPQCGHNIHFENSRAFAERLRVFFCDSV